MFAQGQLLGMQTDLLNRLKVEVNAWEKVAEKHPYSVYNKHELSGSYAAARANDKFTTSFGDGLPYRVYSRNERANEIARHARSMEQPFPLGYTGHIPRTRQVIGQTYGRETRDAINGTGDPTNGENAGLYKASTSQLSYTHPDQEMARARANVAQRGQPRDPSAWRPRGRVAEGRWASSTQLSFQAPPPATYLTPTWTERATSNIGQPDTYGHFKEAPVHRPEDSARGRALSRQSTGPRPVYADTAAAPAAAVRKSKPAAGCPTRPDAWVAFKATV